MASKEPIAGAAAACRLAQDAYHSACFGRSRCHCPAAGGQSCSENRLVKPCLDYLLETINALQQEVLRMRVSNEDKDGSTEADQSKPRQQIDIFFGNASNRLITSKSTDSAPTWGPFADMGTMIVGCKVVSLNPNRVDVFSVSSRYIYHYTWNGTQWGGGSVIPSVQTDYLPAITVSAPYGVNVFHVHADYKIYHQFGNLGRDTSQPVEWSTWTCIGNIECRSMPVAISRDLNLADLFFVGPDGGLYWKSWADMQWKPSGTEYKKLGEGCAGSPAAVARHRGRIDLFVLNTEGQLLHKTWDGSEWEPPGLEFHNLEGSFASKPALVAQGPERFDLFIIGKDGKLYHKALGKSTWKPATGFRNLGGNFRGSTPPTVTSSRYGMDLFLVGGKDALSGVYHKRWDCVEDPLCWEFDPLFKWNCPTSVEAVVRDVTDSGK